ncbi:hypothetical protein AUC31_12330 [Planococcus rifietoensis]|uniref:Lipoprotein n=1 Tax=Planococcus rifietoensis TaxID=200991 RepID=A0A0U2XGI1_9BACL|nr:hypothetical protein [Planococcus rifietoensis]ALS75935.1 hypothetical protein AUC31_12330 [Planococcus rifietoensis]
MRSVWIFIMFFGLILFGLSGCVADSQEDVQEVVNTADTEKTETVLSPEEYYLEYTRPVVTQVWTEYDETHDEMINQCFEIDAYDREEMYNCMILFIDKHEEMKKTVEELPMEGLTGNLSHLKSFQENSLLAIDRRISYCRAIISELGDNGIRQTTKFEENLKMGNRHSIDSMDDIEAYENSLGF